MAEIRELVLTFLDRLSHHALPKNRKRETLDACIREKTGSYVEARLSGPEKQHGISIFKKCGKEEEEIRS